ncbi:hypothetical protein TRICI_001835 [Trichomonascus ciferrii]|uniref:Tyrosine specific protein phosphatases domain-containing protein n=1 Tax=Trichomonascus ciferrii TaxID=44093 RepID=A0A642V7F6_9ASCO|nr:hypothetical protein TRICI_001835 [Trichomonascus ciferrii]
MDAEARPSFPKINVPPCVISQPSILSHWRYEARREAQCIVDSVWLGPLGMSRNEDFLVQNNIRVLVSLMDPRANMHRFMNHPEISFHYFDPGDRITTSLALVSQFDKINSIIDNALQNNVGVMIFCESGNDKSATVCAAYVMHRLAYDYVAAIQYVQSKRFSISLDDANKYVLLTYNDLRAAKRDVGPSDTNGGLSKRALELDDDDDDNQLPTNSSPRKHPRE